METLAAAPLPPQTPRALAGAAAMFHAAGWKSDVIRARAPRRNAPLVERLADAIARLETGR